MVNEADTMSGEGDPVPADLVPKALQRLGRFRKPVQRLVHEVNRIHWMEHAGQPEPWDDQVTRVWDFASAKEVSGTFIAVEDAVWESQRIIGEATGRYDQMDAAEDYWIGCFSPRPSEPSYAEDLLFARIHSDIVGALREVILSDVVDTRFFRQMITWYKRGHLMCGITENGRRVIW